jgi:transposase
MAHFIAGDDRRQSTLLPDCLDDYVTADNPVRLVEVFVDELDLAALGFARAVPGTTGRPAYDPATLLKITSTATSTASRRAAVSNARPSATSS